MNAEVDCKTVRIFAYSSTREQSNKRSKTRLKTESETGERRVFFLSPHTPVGFARVTLLRHTLPISLLILRRKKKQTVLQSNAEDTRITTWVSSSKQAPQTEANVCRHWNVASHSDVFGGARFSSPPQTKACFCRAFYGNWKQPKKFVCLAYGVSSFPLRNICVKTSNIYWN